MTDYQIGTQEEIVEHLKEAGITATQATVSRDIKELGYCQNSFERQHLCLRIAKINRKKFATG